MSKDLAFQESAKRAQENLQWDIQEPVKAITALEFTEELKPELFGLEASKVNEMVSGLSTTLSEREVLKNAYVDVISLEITTETLPVFKELRLKIVKNRTQGLDKWKEREKAFYLAGSNFIQAVYNKELRVNQEMESKLIEAEKFFENQEKEKARLLNLERIEKIRPYVEDADNMNFAEFDDENFDDFVFGKKTRFENEVKAKKEAEAKAELERLAEIERQKAVEAENAKLKAEAEAKEKALQKERAEAKAKQDAIELKAKQEREEIQKKAKIEADKQAKIQAEKDAEIKKLEKELQAQKDIEEAKRLVKIEEAKAPINNQLLNWIDSFELPELALENDAKNEILLKFQGFKNWAKTQIK